MPLPKGLRLHVEPDDRIAPKTDQAAGTDDQRNQIYEWLKTLG